VVVIKSMKRLIFLIVILTACGRNLGSEAEQNLGSGAMCERVFDHSAVTRTVRCIFNGKYYVCMVNGSSAACAEAIQPIEVP
jgi:hypothetical protein